MNLGVKQGEAETNVTLLTAQLQKRLQKLVCESVFEQYADIRMDSFLWEDMLARIAWPRIAEPGDKIAGRIIQLLGPAEALKVIISAENTAETSVNSRCEELGLSGRSLMHAVQRWKPRISQTATEQDIEHAIQHKVHVLTPTSFYWPVGLNSLGVTTPHMLWFQGSADCLSQPSISVVGTRTMSSYGERVTEEFVSDLSRMGFSITSGAAYGVDGTAHRTCLQESGLTVAVLAGGANRFYPSGHARLLEHITRSGGAVCAEPTLGTAPTRWRFLMRNRLIAALGRVTLVPEAGVRSGSINTAGHAAEMGRPVAAVPGSISTNNSDGCHKLIREYGAVLVTSATDVSELAGVEAGTLAKQADQWAETSEGEHRQLSIHARVVDAMPLRGARSAESIARHAGLTQSETLGALAELELLDVAKRHFAHDGHQNWGLNPARRAAAGPVS